MSALKLLVLAVSDRCDQRCLHCQIWSGEEKTLSTAERLRVVEEALAAGIQEALLTGGEPLLSADLWPIGQRLRQGGVRLMLATNGMLLAKYADHVAALFHEVYVSLDGASAISHDRVRGVPAFERVKAGVAALRAAASPVQVIARSTLHSGNLDEIERIIWAARDMGFHHVSFLPIDASSTAFGGRPAMREALLPSPAQMHAYEDSVDRLESEGRLEDGFVMESAAKLRRIGRHLEASAGRAAFERPACDAPRWSLVVEADGAVRPCFFHEPVGRVTEEGIVSLREGERYRAALGMIEGPNATCVRCVCPKKRELGLLARLRAVS